MNTLLSFPRPRPSQTAMTLCMLACLAASPLMAETRYIKPTLEISLRQTQGNSAKVLANMPVGTQVELVQEGNEWSLVRLQDATEGWVRSRFLSPSPILPSDVFKSGPEGQPVIDLHAKIKELSEENSRQRKELAVCTTERSTLADKYQTLAADPNSVQQTKTSLGEAQRQIDELQSKLAAAQIENTVLKKNESIKWFLTGTSVLIFGWIAGRLSSSSRKKKSSLLS